MIFRESQNLKDVLNKMRKYAMFQFSRPVLVVLVVWGCIGPKLQELSRKWLFLHLLPTAVYHYCISSWFHMQSNQAVRTHLTGLPVPFCRTSTGSCPYFCTRGSRTSSVTSYRQGPQRTSPAVGCPWIPLMWGPQARMPLAALRGWHWFCCASTPKKGSYES